MPTILANFLGPDALVVVVIVAVLFGGSQIPKLARSLGAAKSEFEKGQQTGDSDKADTETSSQTKSDSEK
jgi:sec-independent protein translocase protein TatA